MEGVVSMWPTLLECYEDEVSCCVGKYLINGNVYKEEKL